MLLIHGLLAGIIATVLFDIYQIALNYAYGINKTKWYLVGRYFIGLKNNKYFREDLTNDSSEKHELIYGYLIHYAIGIIYGFFYILINIIFYEEPSILIALVFGFTTILGALCIMMPFAYNLGFFASKSDEKNILIVQGLLAHFVFGTGLFIGFSIIF